MFSVANVVAGGVCLGVVFDGAWKSKDMFEGIVVSSIMRQIRDRDYWIDAGIFRKIQFVNEKGDLSNNRVGSLPTRYFIFVESVFRFVNCIETKLDLVINIEFFLTVFRIVVSFGEYIGFVYNYLYIFS